MKQKVLLILSLLFGQFAYADFDTYFENKTLRIDYFHTGDHETELFSLDELIIEPYWGGSKINLIDTFEYGQYIAKVYDLSTNDLIYSRGYSTIFHEWQTVDEAKIRKKSFSETVVIPFPKAPILLTISSRNTQGVFEKKYQLTIDPDDYFIKKENRLKYPVKQIQYAGSSDKKVDIVFLSEGYTENELDVFEEDCKSFSKALFSFSPYSNFSNAFNIYAVLAPSKDSGADIPAEDIWQQTIMDFSFFTFDSERYLMSYNNKAIRDLAANAPYDQIYVLVNTDKYGGGAIYNHYSVSVNNSMQAKKIFVHELGHGFAGLADEYYTSSTSYNDFYNLEIEPYQPNLTTLVDFDSKWKSMMENDIPIPTPTTKDYEDVIGVFEGGGYVAKGMYRPAIDCLMKSFAGNNFCPVCNKAIENMIKFYTK